MNTPDIHEFEVWLSTSDALKAGVLDLDRRKYLVAADDEHDAYRTAVDMAWRDDHPSRIHAGQRDYAHDGWQVTQVYYVP